MTVDVELIQGRATDRILEFADACEADLVARFVPGVREGGYDPAAGYRTFRSTIERLSSG